MLRTNFPRKTSLTALPQGRTSPLCLLCHKSLRLTLVRPWLRWQRSEGTIMWSLKSGRHQYTALLSRRSEWELTWQYFRWFPGVVYQLLCCHVKPWHGSDDSRCELMSITGGQGAPGWAQLCVTRHPLLTVSNKESPGRRTLLDAPHYIFLSRSERSTLPSSRQRNQMIHWNWTTFASQEHWAWSRDFLFESQMVSPIIHHNMCRAEWSLANDDVFSSNNCDVRSIIE